MAEQLTGNSAAAARFAVILPAAGRSVRFGRDKLMEPLGGRAVIAHAVEAFVRRDDVSLVVIPTADPKRFEPALAEHLGSGRVRFCAGGDSRAASVRLGLEQVPADLQWVAVHDAARPLISQDLIDRAFAAARRYGAAVPALPVALTIKEAIGPLPCPVRRTLPRQTLWAMQTPQAMPRDALLAAFGACPVPLDQVTDDAQLLELAGQDVWLIPGEDRNLKITTALDLHVAETLLAPPAPLQSESR